MRRGKEIRDGREIVIKGSFERRRKIRVEIGGNVGTREGISEGFIKRQGEV